MDDTSRDIFLYPETLVCHPPQMDSGWWSIYICAFYPKISLRDKYTCSGVQQRLLLAGGPFLLPLFPLSYDLLLIIDIYP
jgi:hypothetical protein